LWKRIQTIEAPKITEEVEALKINIEVMETTEEAVEDSGIMANIHNPPVSKLI
jgi:hypothetical protein